MPKTLHLTTVTALALALGSTGVPAQPRAPLLSFDGESAVTWVMAPTVVMGQRNPREVFASKDFRLEVDGKAIEIDSFDASREGSITLLFFQDLSGSMANGGKLEASRRNLRCHLDRARPGDEMALVTFASDNISVEIPTTPTLGRVAAQAAHWRAYGTTALHDAITWIPKLRLAPASMPAVLLVTDGLDNASVLDAETARAIARQAEIPVYVLALRGSRIDQRRSGPGRNTEHINTEHINAKPEPTTEFLPFAKILQRLAESTGGRYFEVHHANDIDTACSTITNELRSRYTLGFQLSAQGEEAYHDLRITVPGKNVTLRHRAGYLGSAPQ